MTSAENSDWSDSTPRLRLGELTTKIGSGSTPRGGKGVYVSDGVPFIRSQNVHFAGFAAEGLAYITDEAANALESVKLSSNDILLNITGASIGRACIVPDSLVGGCVSQHVAIIRCTPALEPRFLLGFLRTPVIQDWIWSQNYGVTRQALTKGLIESLEIPLPPLAEQRRIVAKLDALTARLTRGRTELARVPVLAEQLRNSRLAQAFGTQIDRDWPSLEEVGLTIEAGKNLKCDERPPRPDEAGVVKVSAVSGEEFRPEESKTLPRTYTPPERDRIHTGDLLLARASGSLNLVGRVALVGETSGNLFLSDKVLRLCLQDDLTDWVYWFLRSPLGRTQIEDAASGINMHNITQSSLFDLKLPISNAADRAGEVAAIKATFTRTDHLEAEAARAMHLLDRLEAAILAKAFRGELVPQEPASALLARIRQSRATTAKPKSRRRART